MDFPGVVSAYVDQIEAFIAERTDDEDDIASMIAALAVVGAKEQRKLHTMILSRFLAHSLMIERLRPPVAPSAPIPPIAPSDGEQAQRLLEQWINANGADARTEVARRVIEAPNGVRIAAWITDAMIDRQIGDPEDRDATDFARAMARVAHAHWLKATQHGAL